ncbi:hypothetical protein F6V30_14050 [Oryzomonas sagensis]|uniref:Uncharacterized protein n=1 Tax=Oryzomonas sagensis TaxID=2603857 RepID=A0ABQ6TLA1_9BACT|nr:hypothetical protein [Oryzomonas sagensis]KAB0668956.1 hypothetical protein F6V30_14050 [Oryzomonas sagensis]
MNANETTTIKAQVRGKEMTLNVLKRGSKQFINADTGDRSYSMVECISKSFGVQMQEANEIKKANGLW